MYRIPIYRCTLVREGGQSAQTRPTVRCPEDAAAILRVYLADADREMFVILLLNTRSRVIGINTVTVGTLTESLCHPREVFKSAILLGATNIVLAHNHPSGDPAPSPEDIASTKRLLDAGKLLGIDVVDHLILGEGDYVSLKQRQLM